MENGHKTYPVSYSNDEIKGEIDKLSRQIQDYKRTDILDDLIKNAVRFNLGYSELQNREDRRHTNYIWVLSLLSFFVAVASFLVAWFAYKSSETNTQWQDSQTRALCEIRNEISGIKEAQTKLTQMNRQKPAPNKTPLPTP